MTIRLLALLPAALLLTGAAAPSIDEIAECRLDYGAMRAAIAPLPLARTLDSSKDGKRDISTYFAAPMPTAFGFRAESFGTSETGDANTQNFIVISRVAAPLDDVLAAVRRTHGVASCPEGEADGCMGLLRETAEGQLFMVVTTADDGTLIGCAYRRTGG